MKRRFSKSYILPRAHDIALNDPSPTSGVDAHNDRGPKARLLMVGMHLTKTRGGITTLTDSILRSKLTTEFDTVYIASQAEDYGRVRKLILAISSLAHFARLCVLSRPELVYVHVGSNASLYRESVFIMLAKAVGLKVLTHFHAGDIDEYYPFQPKYGRAFIRRGLRASTVLIAVSRESEKQLRSLVPDGRITLLPNAIDTRALHNVLPFGKRDTGNIHVLFLGAVGKLKGENDLLMALRKLKDTGLPIRASILGHGADQLASKCGVLGIDDMIEHLGPVSMNERINFLHRADIFVLPTYAEAMPMSVIEAMAAGLPVITTPVGGIPELIRDGEEGLLVEPGDVDALAAKIEYLAGSKTIRSMLGSNAQKKVSDELNFEKYIADLRNKLLEVFAAK